MQCTQLLDAHALELGDRLLKPCARGHHLLAPTRGLEIKDLLGILEVAVGRIGGRRSGALELPSRIAKLGARPAELGRRHHRFRRSGARRWHELGHQRAHSAEAPICEARRLNAGRGTRLLQSRQCRTRSSPLSGQALLQLSRLRESCSLSSRLPGQLPLGGPALRLLRKEVRSEAVHLLLFLFLGRRLAAQSRTGASQCILQGFPPALRLLETLQADGCCVPSCRCCLALLLLSDLGPPQRCGRVVQGLGQIAGTALGSGSPHMLLLERPPRGGERPLELPARGNAAA
mmetsp:Transcript_70215/g.150365  ORF Transcript_70215/g.150365 Transcript_70215/m.150365 type:complete len:289 (-) Transcript_70215:431-1297(-)